MFFYLLTKIRSFDNRKLEQASFFYPLGSQKPGTETEKGEKISLPLSVAEGFFYMEVLIMEIVTSIVRMKELADRWRKEGRVISFVPTMGYLHDGHLALMKMARNKGDILVISIFVNPVQFGPGEDFERYPRDFERDKRLAESIGVDVIFMPEVSEMYPEGFQTYVEVTEVSKPLCGKSRPGHFRGVTTVVAKLFNIVKPHLAIFGEKDYQQLQVIKRMVKDLNMDVEIVGHPIVREEDGLAMSSRNVYLSPDERKVALRISRSLEVARNLVKEGVNSSDDVIREVRKILTPDDKLKIDYVEIRDPESLESVSEITSPVLLAIAAFVGKARLIDNTILNPSDA